MAFDHFFRGVKFFTGWRGF